MAQLRTLDLLPPTSPNWVEGEGVERPLLLSTSMAFTSCVKCCTTAINPPFSPSSTTRLLAPPPTPSPSEEAREEEEARVRSITNREEGWERVEAVDRRDRAAGGRRARVTVLDAATGRVVDAGYGNSGGAPR